MSKKLFNVLFGKIIEKIEAEKEKERKHELNKIISKVNVIFSEKADANFIIERTEYAWSVEYRIFDSRDRHDTIGILPISKHTTLEDAEKTLKVIKQIRKERMAEKNKRDREMAQSLYHTTVFKQLGMYQAFKIENDRRKNE